MTPREEENKETVPKILEDEVKQVLMSVKNE